MRRSLAISAAACAIAGLLVPHAEALPAAEGSLDQSFGYGGTVLDTGAAQQGVVHAVLQPDGKLLVLTEADLGSFSTVVRYRVDGGLDQAFGDHGRFVVPAWPGGGLPSALALQSDGRILLTGGSGAAVQVARLLADGQTDTSFGDGGVLTKPVAGSGQDYGRAILQQPDGKIVVAGTTNGGVFLMRLRSGGASDTGFGSSDGVITANYQRDTAQDLNGTESVSGVALTPTGAIATAGTETSNGFSGVIVRRWTSSGQPDPDFGGGFAVNLVSNATHALASSVAVQRDGKILVGGAALFTDFDGFVIRYDTHGAIDPTFGESYDTNFGTYHAWLSHLSGGYHVSGIALQRNGSVVVAGGTVPGSTLQVLLARLTTQGAYDSGFASSGSTSFSFVTGDPADTADVFVGRDGRLTLAGLTSSSDNYPVLARFVGDATPPSTPLFVGRVPLFAMAAQVRFTWKGTDDNTGVKSYDVQRREASYTSSRFSGWRTVRSGSATSHLDVKRAAGQTVCLRVRAHDWAGNLGSYSAPKCTAFPVDDRKMSTHGSWSNLTGSSFYLHTARRSTSAGASLTTKATYNQLALVATTCPTCGKAKVYRGSTLLATIDLHSATTHNKVLKYVVTGTVLRTGTIRIVQVSAGKRVVIDGLAVTLDVAP